MRFPSLALLCAAAASALPSAGAAQTAPNTVELQSALIAEEGLGDVAVYVSDAFLRSAPLAPEPLSVITLHRSNGGDALNSPGEDLNALHAYLKANGGFAASDLVAAAASRDIIRVYFRGKHDALAKRFNYGKATLAAAAPADWARLRAIGIPDYARYLAKHATRQVSGMRWVFGDKIPPAEGHPIALILAIQAPDAAKARSLAAALKKRRFDGDAPVLVVPPASDRLVMQARFRFSEEAFQRHMVAICADAAKRGGECVAWRGKFDTVKLDE